MANTILIKRGQEANISSLRLAEGEIALAYNAEKTKVNIYAGGADGTPVLITKEVDLEGVVTEANGYTDTKINELVNGAPEAMDTLKELADAISSNSDIMSALQSAIGDKVDKVPGKGLSTEDYTSEEKEKLAGLSNYVHPETHEASMIVEDSTHRFVSDSEKTEWNDKLDEESIIDGGTF